MLLGARIGAWGAAKKEPDVPYDYRVEWAATDGVAWVDTGFIPPSNTGGRDWRWTLRFSVDTQGQQLSTQVCYVFGSRVRTSSAIYVRGSVNISADANGNVYEVIGRVPFKTASASVILKENDGTSAPAGKIYALKGELYDGLYHAVNMDTLERSADNEGLKDDKDYVYDKSVTIFGNRTTGDAPASIENAKYVRIHSLTLELDGEYRHYIPVVKNGVCYFYETTTGQLLGNSASSGEILHGPELVKPYDYLVEWIRSDGQAYIDVPINSHFNVPLMNVEDIHVEADVIRPQGTTIQHIFGIHPLNTIRYIVPAYTATAANIGALQIAGKSATLPYEPGSTQADNVVIDGHTDAENIYVKGWVGDTLVRESSLVRGTPSATEYDRDRFTIFAVYNVVNSPPIYQQFLTEAHLKYMRIRSTTLGVDLDLRPCVKDGEACLYDEVSDTLLRNTAGVGALVAGPKIGAPYDYLVDYIQSDGFAYIDTGIGYAGETTSDRNMLMETTAKVDQWPDQSTDNLFRVGPTTRLAMGVYMNTDGSAVFRFNSPSATSVWRAKNGEFFSWRMGADGTNGWAEIDGTVLFNSALASSATKAGDDTKIYLFGCSYQQEGGESSLVCGSKFLQVRRFRFVNYNKGQEFDGIACVKDGVGYLYDRITGRLFGNSAGTGALLFGERING